MNTRGGFMGRLQEEQASFRLTELRRGAIPLLIRYLRPYRCRLLLAALCMSVAAGAVLLMPLLSKIAVDDYIVPGDITGLTRVALLYLVLVAVFWPASYGQGYLSGWIGQRVVYDIRNDLVRAVLRQSLEFHQRERVGKIMSRITNDINAVADFASSGLINLVNDVLTVCGIVVVMTLLSVRLTLVTLLSVPVVLLSVGVLARKMRQAYTQVQEEIAAVNAGVEQGVAGMRVTQTLARESFSIEQFEALSLRNMKANLRTAVLFACMFPVMTVSNMLSVALVLGYGGTLVARGSLTLGVILAFLGYVSRVFGPLRELSLVANSMQAAAASLSRIQEYLETPPQIPAPRVPRKPPARIQGHIEFRGVTFAYEEEPALRDIDLTVQAGEILAVVGPTGAGKSTLALLLARLYQPQTGCVEIDGISVDALDPRILRDTVNLVPQDPYLFPDTIRENIRYGNPAADDEAVERAARRVHAHDFIERLPRGYDSDVGEAGVLLSGGQKQLVALARAMLADPVILVLDETTAHVDAITESTLQAGMRALARTRTMLIIAHRFSTVKQADRVVVLDAGRIAGYGTHAELTDSNPVYQRLYRKQWASPPAAPPPEPS